MQDGQSSMEPEKEETQSLPAEPKVISGFWRRLFALLIDTALLGFVGVILGILLFDALASFGVLGRLVGFGIALLYFGLLNSSVGDGQTIGKRLTKIKVINRDGQYISVAKSLLRYTILSAPFFLNGAPIPLHAGVSIVGALLSFIVFGMGTAIVYLYIFNRKTRQSLHDLVVGTFVVDASAPNALPVSEFWRGHLVVSGALCTLALVAPVVLINFLGDKGPFPDLLTVQEHLYRSANVRSANVNQGVSWGTTDGQEWRTSYFSVNAVWNTNPESLLDGFEKAGREVAGIILASHSNLDKIQVISVNITYGFDIGIASAWKSHSFQHSPEEWRKLLQKHQSAI